MPVSRLTSVVLPAPLGPIRPRISPGATEKSTALVATSPPKRLDRRWVARIGARSAISRLPHPLSEQPARTQQQDGKQQHESVGILIGRRDHHGAERFDDAEEEPGNQRARDRAEAADHDDLK